MRILIKEKLSEHKYKTPEGYLVCTDAILARTGKQTYTRDEVFHDDDNTEIEIDRKPAEVFSLATLASFENKPLTLEHPDEDINAENYKDYAIGFVRDVRKGQIDGQDVILGTLVVTDADAIAEIENGTRTELSCGYDCDIEDEPHPQQKNIRGNHVALCSAGRAGIARIIDTIQMAKMYDVYPQRGETKEHFLARFMRETESEYPNRKQRYAVANSYWEKKEDKKMDDDRLAYSENDYDITDEAASEVVRKYQRWIDFDMKKYGRISNITKEKIKKAGFRIAKDQYGDYEIIDSMSPRKNKTKDANNFSDTDIKKIFVNPDGEIYIITEYGPQNYFIRFYGSDGYISAPCTAGGYETVEEAEKMLKKFRGSIQEIDKNGWHFAPGYTDTKIIKDHIVKDAFSTYDIEKSFINLEGEIYIIRKFQSDLYVIEFYDYNGDWYDSTRYYPFSTVEEAEKRLKQLKGNQLQEIDNNSYHFESDSGNKLIKDHMTKDANNFSAIGINDDVHRLTAKEKEIKQAVIDWIRYKSDSAARTFMWEGIKFDGNIVLQHGKPLFKIQHNYSQRKIHLGYPEITPTLIYIKDNHMTKDYQYTPAVELKIYTDEENDVAYKLMRYSDGKYYIQRLGHKNHSIDVIGPYDNVFELEKIMNVIQRDNIKFVYDSDVDVAEYQKWVDYDMKRYGHISAETRRKIAEAGLEIVKNEHDNYEITDEETPRQEVNRNLHRDLPKFQNRKDSISSNTISSLINAVGSVQKTKQAQSKARRLKK